MATETEAAQADLEAAKARTVERDRIDSNNVHRYVSVMNMIDLEVTKTMGRRDAGIRAEYATAIFRQFFEDQAEILRRKQDSDRTEVLKNRY